MAIKSKPAALGHPVDAGKWAQIRAAERVSYSGPYGIAHPPQMSWKTDGIYTCPELRHRSREDNHPSLISGRRVYR
ncbi:hypothetical protein M4R23_01845 [Acidovorax sp. GBBC 3332]|nr:MULTISPECIES: hypothetical protein [unclassified Acidovorax]MDA8448461.1 hypothetical protein [Acidovorax sp. GBBC 3297]MDA8457572.1 hypothetical protein [Acidovorax sp. GBBC 3333]MDA8462904.1 hypothetical protein [Acidovorax sp. GBBC 3332]MDA8467642.1 hypothetical protein [Acidovorax sp. GBBC 3299]